MFQNREEVFKCLIVCYFNKKLFKVNERRNEANQNGMVFSIQKDIKYHIKCFFFLLRKERSYLIH